MIDLERVLHTIPIAEYKPADNKKRYKHWMDHMDDLDLEKRKEKEEEKKKDPLKPLRGIVPFVG